VAKHKTVQHLPAPPPAPPAPAPRLLAQLLTALGELIVVAIFGLGVFTAAMWLIAGWEMRSRPAPTHPPRPTEWVCWTDRRYGEVCEPAAWRPRW
jgi:hypothetical protein